MRMFDTVAGKIEGGPYAPKSETSQAWETKIRDRFDSKLNMRIVSEVKVLAASEARLAIMGDDRGMLRIESSLPKLVYGNNFTSLLDSGLGLGRLREFVADHVDGDIPDLADADYLRVDFCHNFNVGSAIPEYIATLGRVSFLQHHRVTDGFGAVEYWNKGRGRQVRIYDKFKEILEQEKRTVEEARGLLRFEIQLRKKSQYLQNRLRIKKLKLGDVLQIPVAYATLIETLNKMCIDLRFVPQDLARLILDEHFPPRRATRLLGVLRRIESEGIEGLRRKSSRSTFYADKLALRGVGFWPPSANSRELPGLVMPSLDAILADVPAAESVLHA